MSRKEFDLKALLVILVPDATKVTGYTIDIDTCRSKTQMRKLLTRGIPKDFDVVANGMDLRLCVRPPRPAAPTTTRPVRRKRRAVKHECMPKSPPSTAPRPILVPAAEVAERINSAPTPPSGPPPFSVWGDRAPQPRPWVRTWAVGARPPTKKPRWRSKANSCACVLRRPERRPFRQWRQLRRRRRRMLPRRQLGPAHR